MSVRQQLGQTLLWRRRSMLHYRLYGCGKAGSTSIKGADVDKMGEILLAINRDGIFRLGFKARL
jgi:hypothetical protein